MNEITIPPNPGWHKNSIIACASDNTVVYGSYHQLVVLEETGPDEPTNVRIVKDAHSQSLLSVDLNKKWGIPNKYAVSVAEDNIMAIWDIATLQKKYTCNIFEVKKLKAAAAVFAGETRVVGVSENGVVVIWNFVTDETIVKSALFRGNVTITCLSSCPHAAWLLAFGASNGYIFIADLRRDGKTLFRPKGDDKAVLALSWCPAPVNIFPMNTRNTVKNKTPEPTEPIPDAPQEDESSVKETITPEDSKPPERVEEKACHSKEPKVNPWVGLVHADDGEAPPEASGTSAQAPSLDFLSECANLRTKILGESEQGPGSEKEGTREEGTTDESERNDESKLVGKDEGGEKYDLPENPNKDKEQRERSSRPFPQIFDHGGDFFDNNADVEKVVCKEESTCEEPSKSEKVNKSAEVANGSEINDGTGKSEAPLEEPVVLGDGQTAAFSIIRPEVIEEEPRIEYLLASASRDKNIYIWRGGTDGRMQTFFSLPKPKRGGGDQRGPQIYQTLCWITPTTLLTSNACGEILSWTLPKPKKNGMQCSVVHSHHKKFVFNIVAPIKYRTQYNWKDGPEIVPFWSHDQCRLLLYDVESKTERLWIEGIPAAISTFSSSPLDPNRVAFGTSAGQVRTWDLSVPHVKIVRLGDACRKLSARISNLAWHPKKELVLAVAMEDGKVGVFTDSQRGDSFKQLPTHFASEVFKIEWGPLDGDVTNMGLYAVAQGQLIIYDTAHPKKAPVVLKMPSRNQVHKLSWKPDFSYLLLSMKDGSVMVLDTDLKLLTTVYMVNKAVNLFAWHPEAIVNNIADHSKCFWLAAATSTGFIIYDAKLLQGGAPYEKVFEKILSKPDCHLKPVTSLVWNPFSGDQMASRANDGLIHIWDVPSGTLVSTFVQNVNSIYRSQSEVVLWSSVDPNLIITGDRCLYIYDITKNLPNDDPEFLKARKKLLRITTNEHKEVATEEKSVIVIGPLKPKKPSKNPLVPVVHIGFEENVDQQVANMRKLLNGEEAEEIGFKLFGDQEQVLEMLNTSGGMHKRGRRHRLNDYTNVWKGDFATVVREAIQEHRVTPQIIAMAPAASAQLWKEACEVYAMQLAEDKECDPLEVASYFMACHKINEAVQYLSQRHLYREALALVKCRFPKDSPVIARVTKEWTDFLVLRGNYEAAVHCCISLSQYERAAQLLAKRDHRKYLEFATELAEKSGNSNLRTSIILKYNDVINLEVKRPEETPEMLLGSRLEAILNQNSVPLSDDDEETGEVLDLDDPQVQNE